MLSGAGGGGNGGWCWAIAWVSVDRVVERDEGDVVGGRGGEGAGSS